MNPTFATAAIALYVAHHIGDYWIQTDHQARHKGASGAEGRIACLKHVGTYTATQATLLGVVASALGPLGSPAGWAIALGVSAWTHYLADRRAPLAWIVNHVTPWNRNLLELGRSRGLKTSVESQWHDDEMMTVPLDNPQLATGAWALDQSWHLLLSVFLPALILATV